MIFCGLLPFPSSGGWICTAEKIVDNLPVSTVIMNIIRRHMIVMSYGHIIITFGLADFPFLMRSLTLL